MDLRKLFLTLAVITVALCNGEGVLAQNIGDKPYEAFIKLGNNYLVESRLKTAGVTITAKYDGFVTGWVKAGVLPSTLMEIDGVEHVSPALQLVTYCDSARYFSRVDAVHEGNRLDMPYLGEGVIVGIIDCGIDFNHINLCDINGATRVKAVYMPLDTTGVQPVVKGTTLPGSCYETPTEIAALTTDDETVTHGTQVAGIAAGAYRENGWYGMAPEADIVACGIPEDELTDVRVANCISYINDYANRVGKPYVVNISLGNNVGSHDGTSYLDLVLQQMSGPGKIFVVAAGNDGSEQVCAHAAIRNQQDTITALLKGYFNGFYRSGYVNAWSKEGKPFNTRLIVADSRNGEILYQSRALGATVSGIEAVFSTDTDSLLAQYYTGSVALKCMIEANKRPSSLCTVDMMAKSGNYVMGIQYFTPLETEISIWTSQYAPISDYGFSWAIDGSAVGSINELATTDSVISVGSYNSRQTVPLRDGSPYYRQNSEPMEISYFSSYGPDENGIARPDVCAPGSVMVSSANRYDVDAPNIRYWQPSAWVNGVEYPYCPDLGTSMSAPVVTGAIALWLQANPMLSAGDIRNILKKTSYKDQNVINGDRPRWGNGKLDVAAGMRYILNIFDLIGDVNGDAEVNIADINVLVNVVLGGDVDASIRLRADVNRDNEVGIADINTLVNIILDN